MYNSSFGIFIYASSILTQSKRAYVLLALTVAMIAALGHLSSAAGAENSSTRSAPPDTTPYTRPAVPEDTTSSGQPARPRTPECAQDLNSEKKRSPTKSSARKTTPSPDAKAPKKRGSDDATKPK